MFSFAVVAFFGNLDDWQIAFAKEQTGGFHSHSKQFVAEQRNVIQNLQVGLFTSFNELAVAVIGAGKDCAGFRQGEGVRVPALVNPYF